MATVWCMGRTAMVRLVVKYVAGLLDRWLLHSVQILYMGVVVLRPCCTGHAWECGNAHGLVRKHICRTLMYFWFTYMPVSTSMALFCVYGHIYGKHICRWTKKRGKRHQRVGVNHISLSRYKCATPFYLLYRVHLHCPLSDRMSKTWDEKIVVADVLHFVYWYKCPWSAQVSK